MSVQVDLKAGHVFSLIVALNVVAVLRTTIRDLLPAITLEWGESERVVRVESVGAVLPDKLSRDTVGFGRIGVVQVECLFPKPVVGETV